MIHTPKLFPIPYLSSFFDDDDIHTIHNPNNVDAELLNWALKYDYILRFGISYTEQSSKWFCIPDSSRLPESELINLLTVHTYDIDLQSNLHENRKMDTVKLVDFVPQDLKSLSNYLQAITPFVELPELQEYLNKYAIPVPADFPGQYYVRKAITLKRLYGDDIDIPNQILHLVPFLGPLHVSLNTRESTIKIYHQFFNLLYKKIFKKTKNLSLTPPPWLVNYLLYLSRSGWMIIRDTVINKFGIQKNLEYHTFLDLLDNIVLATLDIYAILFREGHFEEYLETIFRLWTIMKRFGRKNYDKIMIAFISDVLYWQSIEHPMYNILSENLQEFNEYFVENFHSLIRRHTVGKNYNPEGLRRDAMFIDSQRHNNDFMGPFINTKKYPYTKKNIDVMVKQTALFLVEFFQKIWSNSTSPQHVPQPTTGSIQSTGHKFFVLNEIMKIGTLPTGYRTKSPPNPNIFCDAKDCNINIEIDQLQLYGKVLICGHGYHNECFQKMGFKCHYCLDYLVDGINLLSSSYNDRLESQATKTDQIELENPDELDSSPNDDDDDNFDEFNSNLPSNNLNINIRAALIKLQQGK